MPVVALAVLVAVVAAAVREALSRAGERRASIAAAATLAALAVLPARAGVPFHSVRAGLVAVAVAALPLAILGVRRALRAAVTTPRRTRGDVVVALLAATLLGLGAWTTWTTYLWDEDSAHFGVSTAVARGVWPPVHPLFPGEPFAYHAGYDVLVALVRAFSGWRPDTCCDVVTTACLAVLVAVAAAAGRALGGAKGAALAVVFVPLGYGPGAMCLANGWSIPLACSRWFPPSWVDARTMPPAVISSFFQHPQGLGMPVALAALLVAFAPSSSRVVSWGRVLAAAVLVALSSQAQAVYFGLAAGALVVGLAVDAVRARAWAALAARVAIVLAAVAIGYALGGVFAQAGAVNAIHVGAGYFRGSGPGILAHNLVVFGAPLVALPIELVRLRDDLARPGHKALLRLALTAAGVAGFLVGNAATYERSWDIVKFFAAGAFFGNVVVADLLAALLAGRRGVQIAALPKRAALPGGGGGARVPASALASERAAPPAGRGGVQGSALPPAPLVPRGPAAGSDARIAAAGAAAGGGVPASALAPERAALPAGRGGVQGSALAPAPVVPRGPVAGSGARVAAAVAILTLSTSSAALWLVRHGPLNGVIAPRYTELPPDPVGLALDAGYGELIGTDRVLTTHDEIAQLGFLVVGHDWRRAERGLMLDRARVDREHALAHTALTRLDPAALHTLGVRWLLLTEHERDVLLQPAARALLDDAARADILSQPSPFHLAGTFAAGGARWLLYRVESPEAAP